MIEGLKTNGSMLKLTSKIIKDQIEEGKTEILDEPQINSIINDITLKYKSMADLEEEYEIYQYMIYKCISYHEENLNKLNAFIDNSLDNSCENKEAYSVAKQLKKLQEQVLEMDSVVDLLERGYTLKQIGKILHLSESTIHKRLTKHGFIKNKQVDMWYHIDNKKANYMVRHIMGLKYDFELMNLYEERYGDYMMYLDLKGNNNKIDIDTNVIIDLLEVSADYNTEDVVDLINLILLRFLKENRFKICLDDEDIEKAFENKLNNLNNNITKEEKEIYLYQGENGLIRYFKNKLIKEYKYTKKQLRDKTAQELKDLYNKLHIN